ncbi:MAG TPA: prepilin peptidase [Pirellulales bacterium]|jgi:leader peptidase (prepilin peptidase)/N-methyltransferase|nr:prepilin peptidase [Pirellulales bacterium]
MNEPWTQGIDPLSSALPTWFLISVAVILGAVLGSFLNVVAFRLPRGLSLSYPGSSCPSCHHAIRWHDNIPVLGWLRLGGRCRDCHAPISKRYPAIELLVALLAAARAGQLLWADTAAGQGELALVIANLLFSLALMVSLLAIGLIDLDGFPIPNVLWAVAGVTVVGLLWTESPDLAAAADWLLGAIVLSFIGLIVVRIARRYAPALGHVTWVACTVLGLLGMVFVAPEWTGRLGIASQPPRHDGSGAMLASLHVMALAAAGLAYAFAARSLSAARR